MVRNQFTRKSPSRQVLSSCERRHFRSDRAVSAGQRVHRRKDWSAAACWVRKIPAARAARSSNSCKCRLPSQSTTERTFRRIWSRRLMWLTWRRGPQFFGASRRWSPSGRSRFGPTFAVLSKPVAWLQTRPRPDSAGPRSMFCGVSRSRKVAFPYLGIRCLEDSPSATAEPPNANREDPRADEPFRPLCDGHRASLGDGIPD